MKNEVKEEKIEVVESVDLKKTLITLELYNNHIVNITRAISGTANNLLLIGRELTLVKKDKSYVLDGYKDVYEFSKDKFGFGVTSTKNFINVYSKFCNPDENDFCLSVELKEEYKDYSFSQLIELLPVSEEEIKKYKPEQTIAQIREIKKASQISDGDNKYIKEFNKMAERVNSVFIESLNLNSIESKITFDISNMNFENCFSFEYDKKTYKYVFKLGVDDYHGLNYLIEYSEWQRGCIWVREENFLNLIERLKDGLDRFKIMIDDDKKDKELEIEKKKKEREVLKNCKLKNNQARTDFIEDLNNWNLLSDLPEVNMQIYQFSVIDKFFLLKFGKNIWYFATKNGSVNNWTCGKYEIVNALCEMKY